MYSLPPCHHLWGLILLLLLFYLFNYYFLVVLIVQGECQGALIVMSSMLLYQMLVHRHSNFVNLSKYDALLSLEASKVYCRHCLTRIFSVTFRPVIPLRRLPMNSAVQDWFIKKLPYLLPTCILQGKYWWLCCCLNTLLIYFAHFWT